MRPADPVPGDAQSTDGRLADVLVIIAQPAAPPPPPPSADRVSAASTDLAARTAAGTPLPADGQRALARQIARQHGGDPDAAVAQLERLAAQATTVAGQELAEQTAPTLRRGDVSVTKDAQNRTIVRTADGRTIVVDPRAVPTTQGQEQLIQMAMVKPPDPPPSNDIPPEVIPLAGIVFGNITAMVLLYPLVRAWIRGRERRESVAAAVPAALPAEFGQRLERIEQAVESVAIEVERISESQRFQARVLAERLDAAPLALPTREARDVR